MNSIKRYKNENAEQKQRKKEEEGIKICACIHASITTQTQQSIDKHKQPRVCQKFSHTRFVYGYAYTYVDPVYIGRGRFTIS